MPNIGIAIDAWKRDIFDEVLTSAGYEYKLLKLNASLYVLKVETDNVHRLAAYINEAQAKCRASKH